MIISPHAQGSPEWLEARAVIPTASEFDNLITPHGKIRTGQMVESFLCRKLAEKWLQGPLPGFGVWSTDQGRILEERARPWFEMTFNVDVRQVGLITNDDGTAGCSPDGLIESENCGLEIKCPEAPHHVAYLRAGKVPADYVAQVQGSLLVTRLPQWKFVSYHKDFPKLVVAVEPDEKFCESLFDALYEFNNRLDLGFRELCETNGGPPAKRETIAEFLARNPINDDNENTP